MRLADIDPGGVRSWVMSALNAMGLPTGALYVYARCQRTGTGGVFVVDAEQRIFPVGGGSVGVKGYLRIWTQKNCSGPYCPTCS